jgi:hypothetical protein
MPAQQNDLIKLEVWIMANKRYRNLMEKREETREEHTPLFGVSVHQLFRIGCGQAQTTNESTTILI